MSLRGGNTIFLFTTDILELHKYVLHNHHRLFIKKEKEKEKRFQHFQQNKRDVSRWRHNDATDWAGGGDNFFLPCWYSFVFEKLTALVWSSALRCFYCLREMSVTEMFSYIQGFLSADQDVREVWMNIPPHSRAASHTLTKWRANVSHRFSRNCMRNVQLVCTKYRTHTLTSIRLKIGEKNIAPSIIAVKLILARCSFGILCTAVFDFDIKYLNL